MEVIGYNVSPASLWDSITNVKRYKGMTFDEYSKQQQGNTYASFESNIRTVMSNNKLAIEGLNSAPLGGVLRTVEGTQQARILQVADSVKQWELAKNIVEGTGRAVGWDLETVGDITSRTYDGYAGITEFGLVERVYENGNRIISSNRPKGYALAIGFDDAQVTKLQELVSDFEKYGWDSLADPNQMPGTLSVKQSTLQRLSMMGSRVDKNGRIVPVNPGLRIQSQEVHLLDNKTFQIWTDLGPANFDPSLMRKGIEIGQYAYLKGATPEAVLPDAIKYITDAVNGEDSILYGANSHFDTTSLANVARKAGVDFSEELIEKNTVDIVYGTTKMAAARGESVNTFTDATHKGKVTNINTPASVESQAEALQMGKSQIHFSVEDIINEGDILTMRHYNGTPYIDAVLNSDVEITPYTIQDTTFLINRGKVVNDSADLVEINGELSMQTYPMSNEYWTVGTHNGYVDLEDGYGTTQQRYVLELVNSMDENVKIYKTFDSMEAATDYLLKDTTTIASSRLTPDQIKEQYLMSVRDIGRREYDKLFDIKSISVNGDTPVGGYATLDEYLTLAKELQDQPGFKSDRSLRPALISRIREHQLALDKSARTLKSEYQIQAFAGMFERLIDEQQMLQDIVDIAGNTASDNATRTIMASRARTAIEEAIDGIMIGGQHKYQAFASKETMYALTDVFGIDVQLESSIKRINASSVDAAIPGVRSVFSGLDFSQSVSVLSELQNRGIIDGNTYNKLVHSASINIRPTISNNNFVQDVAHQLTRVMSPINHASNPLELFTQMKSENLLSNGMDFDEALASLNPDEVIHKDMPFLPAQIQAIRKKNLQSIADERYKFTNSKYRLGNRDYKLSTVYSRENLEGIVRNAINTVEEAPVGYYTGEVFKEQLMGIQKKLGYNPQEFDLVSDMFMATEKDGTLKKYAIGKYEQEGLQALVISPERSKNAYVLVTNAEHSNNVISLLMDEDFDTDALEGFSDVNERFGQHASVIELHSINRYGLNDLQLEDGTMVTGDQFSAKVAAVMNGSADDKGVRLTTINQSNGYEKFLNPVFDIYTYNGHVHGKIKNGLEEVNSAWRMNGENVIQSILEGDFESATTRVRRTQNSVFKDLSSPSSYRGIKVGDTVKRVANYHPADFIQAYEVNVKGIRNLMESFITSKEDNAVKDMLTAFNNQYGVVNISPEKPLSNTQFSSIAKSTTFNEFYVKNLFTGNITEELGLQGKTFNGSIFDMLRSSVRDDVTGLFDKSVTDALDIFAETVPEINQILQESAVAHDIVSYKMPGDFNVSSGLFSTLRPLYTQQNRPLYFELDRASELGKMIESTGYTYIGQSSMSRLENTIMTRMDHNNIKSPTGGRFSDQHRAFTTQFKQISDTDLQVRYRNIENDLAEIATKNGLDVSKLQATFSYMRQDMNSVYESKLFLDPLLGNQDFFTTPDAKKITLFSDPSTIDESSTRKILRRLQEQQTTISAGDVIGRSKTGKALFYEGPTAILQDYNVDELMSNGETYILPTKSNIGDIKITVGGSEKGMAHTIDADQLLKYARGIVDFSSRDEAIKYSHVLFQEVFGASVAGNLSAFKHNANNASRTVWDTITSEYVKAGKGNVLVNILGNKDLQEYFGDWNIGINTKGQILVSNARSKYLDVAIEQLESVIRNNKLGDADVNSLIVKSLDNQKANDTVMTTIQRLHINEHLSNSFKMDERIAQGIRFRSWTPDDTGGYYDEVDARYYEALKTRSMDKDLGKSARFLDDNFGAIKQAADEYNMGRMSSTRALNTAVKNNRRNVLGMQEALRYFADPDSYDITDKNILRISMADLLKDHKIPKGGASVQDLEKFLFYIDGKPSEWLKILGEHQQGFNTDAATHSLYIDLGRSITYRIGNVNKTINGVLIPIQNMVTNVQDNQFFTESQRITTHFLDDMIDLIQNPKKEGRDKTFQSSIDEFKNRMTAQSNIMDKDSDAYKAYGRFKLANAGQYQAIDEVAPIIDSMFDPDVIKKKEALIEARNALRRGDLTQIEGYDKLYQELQEVFNKAAESVRNPQGKLPIFSGLKGSGFEELSTIIIDGKEHYNNLVAIGEAGFKARGFDFGQTGLDLVYAHFNDDYSNIPQIANKKPFRLREDEIDTIVKNLQDIGVKDVDRNNLLFSLNDHMTRKYGYGVSEAIDTKRINNAIVNGDLQKIFGAFEAPGKRYAREVGILAEALRYPSFSSQPLVNVVLDDSIQGMGIRTLMSAMSKYTNEDFDGDTKFLAFIMDGGSIAKGNDTVFKEAIQIFRKGSTFNNNLVADMIQDSLDEMTFFADDLNDYRGITASMLNTFKTEEYIDAIHRWAKANIADRPILSIENLTKGELIAAEHSDIMAEAWKKAGINTLTDKGIIRSSLAVPTRKENIGTISTPNFKLRAALGSASKDMSLTPEQRRIRREILHDMTNMGTAKHGLTGIIEQKGIDVKHEGGYGIAHTPKWAMGMNQMFNMAKDTRAQGLENLVKASKHVFFKDQTDAQVKAIINEILTHDRSYFAGTDKLTVAKRQFRSLYEAAAFEDIQVKFNQSIKKGTFNEAHRNFLLRQGLFEVGNDTIEADFEEMFNRYQSDSRILLDSDTVYLRPGTVDEIGVTGWTLDNVSGRRVTLRQVNLEDGTLLGTTTITGSNNVQINKAINEFFGGYQKELNANIFSFKENQAIRDELLAKGNLRFRTNILDSLLLDAKGVVKGYNPDTFKTLASSQLALGMSAQDIERWFSLKDTARQTQVFTKIKEVSDIYQYAIDNQMASSDKSARDLIKGINQDIVAHPENYGQKTKFIDYSDILRTRAIAELGDTTYERARVKRTAVGDFDIKKYKEVLENNQLYGIMNEESRLKTTFATLQNNLDTLDLDKVDASIVKPVQDLLDSADEITSKTLDSLRRQNQATTNKLQDDIYKLFKSTSQMDAQFEWNKVSGTSVVGFGEYIGTQFNALTNADIKNIIDSIDAVSQTSKDSMTQLQRHALEQTRKALKTYQKKGVTFTGASTRNFKKSTEVEEIVFKNQDTLNNMMKSISTTSSVDEAVKKTMKTNKVSSSLYSSAKEALSKVPMKTVGIAVGAMAALGIVNNALHGQRTKSPLTPQRNFNSESGNSPSMQSPASSQAPMSNRRTVYHDKGSGFNFKVSAKTQGYINDMNNAKLIGMSGGGNNPSVYSQADMSGVTDNWLENKFAELT